MKHLNIIMAMLLLSFSNIITAQKTKTDANIVGHVTCSGNHLPFATVGVKGTTIGTETDETGHYQLINLPIGEHVIISKYCWI